MAMGEGITRGALTEIDGVLLNYNLDGRSSLPRPSVWRTSMRTFMGLFYLLCMMAFVTTWVTLLQWEERQRMGRRSALVQRILKLHAAVRDMVTMRTKA